MRFILVNWTFKHDGVIGGCESFHDKLAFALTKAGHEVDFVSYKTVADDLGIRVPYERLHLPEVEVALLIDKHLQKHYRNKDDGIIVRDAGVGGFLEPSLPQIAVFGNPYFTLNDELLRRGLVQTLSYNRYHDICTYFEKRTAENSLQNVGLSNFMAKVEMRSLGIQCHKVINNGVDMQLFRPREKDNLRKKYGVPANALVACWVGSSHPIKGIQVISELILKYPEVYWILVFKGQPGPRGPLIPSSLAELVDRIRRTFVNVTKRRIMKLKQLQPQQLSKIYAMSDFCVLPYLCEGNSHAVLEACSSNLPLITTKTGLFWDFWDDRIGVAVDKSRDVQEYCDAIAKIRGDLSAFGPRSVISEQKLDLESWSDTWVKYLTQDIAPGLSRPTVR